jgi:ATPase subunit of ABC transporter with duplicated ATPase domains
MKQVLIAQAIVTKPICCCREPTNHLDLAAIEWLEDFWPAGGRR